MASVLQGVDSVNYETDLFRTLIDASASATGVTVRRQEQCRAIRVIADHLRSSSFLIADGVLPSNEGRGYVLRRIMRRAMRHAQLLGAAEPLMWKLVPALVREMGQAYPELVRGEALITETLKLEETRFRKTLARGLGLLADATETLGAGDMLDGETAFKLYDTYGFPLDLTQDALRQRSISVDIDGFTDAMERQKAEARASWAGSGDAATETVWFCRPREGRRHRVPRLRDREGRGHRRCRWCRTARSSTAPRKATRSPSSSTRRRSMASPAARWATPAPSPAKAFRST